LAWKTSQAKAKANALPSSHRPREIFRNWPCHRIESKQSGDQNKRRSNALGKIKYTIYDIPIEFWHSFSMENVPFYN